MTDERMKSLIIKSGGACRGCMLQCGYEHDMVEHYGRCSVFWSFVAQRRGTGLGIPYSNRSAEAFLLVSDATDEDKIRMVLGMYALYRTINALRHADPNSELDASKLLKIWVRRAAYKSKAYAVLSP